MSVSIVAKRYARAFFDLALEKGVLPDAENDISGIAELLRDQPDFAAFVENPVIPAEQQTQALQALFANKLRAETLEFLHFLVAKNRLNALQGICRAFAILGREHHNILEVTVTSAIALTPEQVERIREKLRQRYGKTIELSLEEDPALIGGFQIQVGDQVLDSSVATKLETFRRNVLNA